MAVGVSSVFFAGRLFDGGGADDGGGDEDGCAEDAEGCAFCKDCGNDEACAADGQRGVGGVADEAVGEDGFAVSEAHAVKRAFVSLLPFLYFTFKAFALGFAPGFDFRVFFALPDVGENIREGGGFRGCAAGQDGADLQAGFTRGEFLGFRVAYGLAPFLVRLAPRGEAQGGDLRGGEVLDGV